jgi:phosphoribosylamine--glycine ligase
MLGPSGPQVVEFNARFGDPETQSILPLLEGSLSHLLASAARGALEPEAVRRASGAAVTVALVDEGYPGALRGDGVIRGLDEAERDGVLVFHAGTRRVPDGWAVRGGRAAYLTATGRTRTEARERVDTARAGLSGTGWRSRHDVAVVPDPVRSA